jgi:AraC-like DNA-binding protein
MVEYLYVGSITIIAFLILLITSKPSKALSDVIFLSWLTVLLVNVLSFLIILKFNYPEMLAGKLLIELSEASGFLHGPIFLFYTFSLTRPNFRLSIKDGVHLLPFVVSLTMLAFFVLHGGSQWMQYRLLLTIVKMGSILIYSILVIRQLRNHASQVESFFSNTENKYLRWLSFLAWGVVLVWTAFAVGLTVYNFDVYIPQFGGSIGNVTLCVFIFLIGYFGIRQDPIFNFHAFIPESTKIEIDLPRHFDAAVALPDDIDPKFVHRDSDEVIPGVSKYRKSGLSPERSLTLVKMVEEYMDTEKPYLESELTLFTLAEKMNIHPNHLSQIVNHHFKQNFFDFINEYRVSDVKKAIAISSHTNLTFLGIAMEFGFSSKASFNRAFKKSTGMTPTLFKKLSRS